MCAEVKVKASEINENSGGEEALGMDTDLSKKKKKNQKKTAGEFLIEGRRAKKAWRYDCISRLSFNKVPMKRWCNKIIESLELSQKDLLQNLCFDICMTVSKLYYLYLQSEGNHNLSLKAVAKNKL